MVAYADLDPTDKAVLQNGVNLMRAGAGEMAKVWNHWKAIADDTNLIAIFNSVDNTETIPNTSGLPGADDMLKSEIATLFLLLDGIRSTNDDASFRAQATKAAGINATLA